MWIPRTRTPRYQEPASQPPADDKGFDLWQWLRSLVRTPTPRYDEGPPDGGYPEQ